MVKAEFQHTGRLANIMNPLGITVFGDVSNGSWWKILGEIKTDKRSFTYVLLLMTMFNIA